MKSESLDAIIFVGLILPILANNNEQKDELAEQAAGGGLEVVTVTGGPGVDSMGADLLDHSARVRAVEVGSTMVDAPPTRSGQSRTLVIGSNDDGRVRSATTRS